MDVPEPAEREVLQYLAAKASGTLSELKDIFNITNYEDFHLSHQSFSELQYSLRNRTYLLTGGEILSGHVAWPQQEVVKVIVARGFSYHLAVRRL